MSNLEKAKSVLHKGRNTCVLSLDDTLYTSKESGVKPMLSFISKGYDLKGFSAADRVIGKAAAMLFIYAGVREVYGLVLSKYAIDILTHYGVGYSCDELISNILNRTRTGICPMEKAVESINEPEIAYIAIIESIRNLATKNGAEMQ